MGTRLSLMSKSIWNVALLIIGFMLRLVRAFSLALRDVLSIVFLHPLWGIVPTTIVLIIIYDMLT